MSNTNRFVYVAAAIAAINGALFGYDTGIISGAQLPLAGALGDSRLDRHREPGSVHRVLRREVGTGVLAPHLGDLPLEVRGAAMSVASVDNWTSNLLVSLTFSSLVGAIGRPFTFWLYAVVGVAALVFVYFLVPETKGRSLEEIQNLWSKRSGEKGDS